MSLPDTNLESKTLLAKYTTLSIMSALALALFAWQILRADGPLFAILAIQIFPLAIFVPALIKNNPKAYIGVCFIILMYFIKGVEGVFMPTRAWVDIVIIIASVVIFISAMMASRWLQLAQIQKTE